MKRLLSVLLALLSVGKLFAQVDSIRLARLDSYVEQYVAALTLESISVKEAECDFMINSAKDSLMRNHIGDKLYRYYRDSAVMGEEEVAIYLWDKWFEPKLLSFEPEDDKTPQDCYYNARLFADFNRSTLIGETAPELVARMPCGVRRKLPRKGTPAILYFYDTACGKCALESKLMPSVLSKSDRKLNFYAFYCGTDKKAWRKFRKDFKLQNPSIRLVHLWDPEVDSDYLRLYGVITTPKLYVTTAGNQILGRRLELENLIAVLELL